MGGIVIWLVVIVYIVLRCTKNAKRNEQNATPNVSRSARQPQSSGRYMQMQRPVQQRVPYDSNRQMQRPQQTKRPQPATQPSILQKAKANAARQFDDDTKPTDYEVELGRVPVGDEIMKDKAKARHIHSVHEEGHSTELGNEPGVDDFDTYHLIDEVNDLIVKGYSGDLEFERDFLAEATDMLNRMYN